MNITLTPCDGSKVDIPRLVQYCGVINEVLRVICKKNPESPKFSVSITDVPCDHVYRFVVLNDPVQIHCIKCGKRIHVHREPIDANFTETGAQGSGQT